MSRPNSASIRWPQCHSDAGFLFASMSVSRRVVTSFLLATILLFCVISPSDFTLLTEVMASSDPASITNSSSSSSVPIAIGYLRMSGIDNAATMAAYLTTIYHANKEAALPPGFRYVLDVTTIDCADDDGCWSALQTTTGRNQLKGFIAKLPSFAAVLRPCHIVAPDIIDAAIAAGGVPVLNPITIREKDFKTETVITFNQFVRSEIGRIFTFMQNDYACAISGVLYDGFSEMPTHVDFATSLFTEAGMATPERLNVGDASTSEIRNFVARGVVDRRCFLVLTTNAVFRRVMNALADDADFDPNERRMYGVSLMGADNFVTTSGNTQVYSHTSFVRWYPTLEATNMSAALEADSLLAQWRGNATAAEEALFTDFGNEIPQFATDFTLQSLLISQFLIENIHTAMTRRQSAINSSARVPFPRDYLLDAIYSKGTEIGGYPFMKAVRECPPKPLKQICFCNTMSSTSYMYQVNVSSPTGKTIVIHDNASEGQRDVASVALTSPCAMEVGGWAYPITGMFLIPREFTTRVGLTPDEVKSVYDITSRSFGSLMREINYAPVAPARPYRYVVVTDVESTDKSIARLGAASVTEAAIELYAASYKPFVVLGSMSERLNTAPILTLFPSLIEIDNEDPVLTPHDRWQWQVVNLRPVMADILHAYASYFEASEGQFTSVHIITATHKAAELASKSFATFGYDVPVSSIVVTDSADAWFMTVRGWLQSPRSANPFVLAVSGYNPNNCVEAAYRASLAVVRGTLALAVTESIFYNTYRTLYEATASSTARNRTDDTFTAIAGEIVFPSFLTEWWTKSTDSMPAEMRQHAKNPRYHMAAAAVEFIKRLGDGVQYDFGTTAAEQLYNIQTVSAENIVWGPFSNATCSAEEIATNAVDRRCQCTKGVRAVFIHSAFNFVDNTPSTRTNRYKYTMTTCGVEYKPYVPPVVPFALSQGAIIGIAVGCAIIVLALILTAVLVNYYCIGRNNRTAPKDASKPFAIVFTDIQSSTALWARAPNAMSDAIEEHHSIIRKMLSRNDGYEVKTVGDSFMIAFKDVDDAVAFSLETQIALNRGEWSPEIDAIYIELLAEAGIDNDDLDANKLGGKTDHYHHNNRKQSAHRSVGDDNNDSSKSDSAIAATPSVFGGAAPSAIMSLQSASQFHPQQQQQYYQQQVPPPLPAPQTQIIPAVGQKKDKAATTGKKESKDNTNINNGVVSNVVFLPPDASSRMNAAPSTNAGDQSTAVYQSTAGGTAANNTIAGTAATGTTNSSGAYRTGKAVANPWHGVRVRIGVHYGLGEIRKDPVSLGYDYYGTVVNTAARVEGVGHGGQILVTDEALEALSYNFLKGKKVVLIGLGPQPLRGLDAPIKLHQLTPASLEARRFPALRLHIEKISEEDLTTDTSTATTGTSDLETPEDLVARICAVKQNAGVSPDALLVYYYYITMLFGTSTEKYRWSVITRLAEQWGFETAAKNSKSEGARRRLLVSLLAKVTKAFGNSKIGFGGGGGGNSTSSRSGGVNGNGNGRRSNGSMSSRTSRNLHSQFGPVSAGGGVGGAVGNNNNNNTGSQYKPFLSVSSLHNINTNSNAVQAFMRSTDLSEVAASLGNVHGHLHSHHHQPSGVSGGGGVPIPIAGGAHIRSSTSHEVGSDSGEANNTFSDVLLAGEGTAGGLIRISKMLNDQQQQQNNTQNHHHHATNGSIAGGSPVTAASAYRHPHAVGHPNGSPNTGLASTNDDNGNGNNNGLTVHPATTLPLRFVSPVNSESPMSGHLSANNNLLLRRGGGGGEGGSAFASSRSHSNGAASFDNLNMSGGIGSGRGGTTTAAAAVATTMGGAPIVVVPPTAATAP